ncbi:unnamed protein product [Symbiodinium sp. CCMP2592]|nr:unnamed protein product [Symbiodinium sp. CCMP2592]
MERVRGVLAGLPPLELELEELGDPASLAPQPEAPSPAGSVYTPVNAPSTYWRTTICPSAPHKRHPPRPSSAESTPRSCPTPTLSWPSAPSPTQNYLGAFGLPSPMEKNSTLSSAFPQAFVPRTRRAYNRPSTSFVNVLGSVGSLEALIFSECSERETNLQRASEQLRHLRRLERVALAGADVRRLAQLRQLQQELLRFADLRSSRSLRFRSGEDDFAVDSEAEKSVASLLRDVRHWHAELRRLEQHEAQLNESFSGPIALATAEISVLRQVLAEQEEGRKACEECLRHPARTSALPLGGTPPSTLSTCNASVAAGIRLATGAARAQLPKILAMTVLRRACTLPTAPEHILEPEEELVPNLPLDRTISEPHNLERVLLDAPDTPHKSKVAESSGPGLSNTSPDKPEEKNLRRRLRLASDIVAETDYDCGAVANRNECGLQV